MRLAIPTFAYSIALVLCVLRPITAAEAGHYRQRLPQDEVIYFLLPDRFENGDRSNDRGGLSSDRLSTGFDPTAKGFYHGGDLKGLINRLDYVQSLGATAIWLGPVYRNRPVQGPPGDESAGYHGYWITDFTHVDPHLGTDAELQTLVSAVHARGMKIYLDIITNHTADVIAYKECRTGACPYRARADYPGNFAYTPYIPAGMEQLKVPAWLNDVTVYHNRGNSTFTGESSDMGDFVGLDDLKTEDPRVVQGFIRIYGDWIDRLGVDGFRIDTAKHVNVGFWQSFVPAMQTRALSRGVPNFHIFGEVATDDFDPALTARFTRTAKMSAVLDFSFALAVRRILAGDAGTDLLATLFADDVLYEGGASAAQQLPTFVSNHDSGRLAFFIQQQRPKASADEVQRRVLLAHAMLFTLRGVPVVYSGDEQGFVGHGGDQAARQDMFASRVDSYNDQKLLGTTASNAQANFNPTHPLYVAFAQLARLRTQQPALRRGVQLVRNYSGQPGLFAVSRFDPDTGRELVIAFNTSTQPLTARVEVESGSTTFASLHGRCASAVAAVGSYPVTLAALDYVVCAAVPR
jgi:glycosidase